MGIRQFFAWFARIMDIQQLVALSIRFIMDMLQLLGMDLSSRNGVQWDASAAAGEQKIPLVSATIAPAALNDAEIRRLGLEGKRFVQGVNVTDQDLVTRATAVNIQTAGKITNEGEIEFFVPKEQKRRVVINARAFSVTSGAGDITNNRPVYFTHNGTGAIVTDTSTHNISTGKGSIINRNPINGYYGEPPAGFVRPSYW